MSNVPTQQAEWFSSYVPQEDIIGGHYNNIESMRSNISAATSWMQDCCGGQTFVKVTAIKRENLRIFYPFVTDIMGTESKN